MSKHRSTRSRSGGTRSKGAPKPAHSYSPLQLARVPEWAKRGGWPKLLETWTELLARFEMPQEGEKKDVAYWYGERALVSLLAAAAWMRKGGWSLVEFLGERKNNARRGDLWLGTGSATYTVEFKLDSCQKSVDASAKRIEKELRKARRQVRAHVKAYRQGHPVAACFAVPERATRIPADFFGRLASKLGTDDRLIAVYRSEANCDGKSFAGVLLVAEPTEWKS